MMRPYFWIKLNYRGKEVGKLRSDKFEFVTVRNKAHFFRKFNGFAFSRDLLLYLKNLNVVRIKVIYLSEIKQVWTTYLDIFFRKGISYDNEGDAQLVLKKEYWKIKRLNENELEKEVI